MAALLPKFGVKFDRIAPAGAAILAALGIVALKLNRDFILSCGTEDHAPEDPHTTGEAYDVSVTGWDESTLATIVGTLQETLGDFFTVLYEAPPTSPAPTSLILQRVFYVNACATAPHLHIQRRKGLRYTLAEASIRTVVKV